MTLVILVCHAPLGQALHAVACHAFGRYIAEVAVADISATEGKEDAMETIERVWINEGKPSEVMLLTDIMGATPSNAVSGWLKKHPEINARALAGVSVPITLRALTYRELPAEALCKKLSECVVASCAAVERAS